MEREMFKVPLTVNAVNHGFKIGVKVYEDKLSFSDKWHVGGANELQADIYGFIAETVVDEFFGQPLPALTKQKNDLFDLTLGGLNIDVKKVGYSRFSARTKITLNKKQTLRKMKYIDAFLFCTFNGAFDQKMVKVDTKDGDWEVLEVWLPQPIASHLWLIGWIKSGEIEEKSRIYVWKDKSGKPRDESFWLKEEDLRDVKELIE